MLEHVIVVDHPRRDAKIVLSTEHQRRHGKSRKERGKATTTFQSVCPTSRLRASKRAFSARGNS